MTPELPRESSEPAPPGGPTPGGTTAPAGSGPAGPDGKGPSDPAGAVETVAPVTPALEAETAVPPAARRIPLRHRIQVKFWAGIFLVSIVPLAVLGVYSFGILTRITRDLLIKSNLQAVQQVKTAVDQEVNLYINLISFLQGDRRLADPAAPAAAEALRQMHIGYEFIERIVLCASDGALLAHSAKTPGEITALTALEQAARQAPAALTFGAGRFLIRAPVGDRPGAPSLVATISFHKLRKTLEGMAFGTSFRFFLVTRDGINILEQPGFPAGLVRQLLERPFGGYDIGAAGNGAPTQVAVILPILPFGLRLIVMQDAGEVYAAVGTIKRNIYLVILVVMVIAFLVGTAFSFRITSPIIAIADKANQISGGNLAVNIISDRRDEIGFLATCFNHMTSRVRRKVFELSALFRISQIVNQAASYQKALDDTMTYIVTAFLAQRGSIQLVAEPGDHLQLRSVRFFGGLNPTGEEPRERIALRLTEGIAGLAMSTGRPVLCEDCRADPRFKPYPADLADLTPHRLLSVPLVVQGKAVGVINLADRANNQPFTDEDQEVLLAIATQVAMSIDNAKLHELAITDGLTQLFIHRFFQLKLDDELKRARRYGEPLALILFDIDHFKKFNDTWGHQLGDQVLRETARLLRNAVRASDIPCRYGGEEFTVILPHTTAEQAYIFAERFRQKVANHPIGTGGDAEVKITISIGIAEFPAMAADKVGLIRKADIALYHCKEKGRNCTSLYLEGMGDKT
ncbi:MAG: diguanylate cyclase [Candidatus Riflebacteria bacterium]|nr:diguanylate cyclase [Candidatus Riflebacteria bacterium]